jgi:hypothetical protein
LNTFAKPIPGVAAILILAGCAIHRPALPMTAEGLEADGSAAGLVAYLGQPGADGRICGPLPLPPE